MAVFYESQYTVELLMELEKSIAQGVQSVTHQDKTVVYRSLKEMLVLRNVIRRSLGLAGQGNGFFGGYKKVGRFDKDLA